MVKTNDSFKGLASGYVSSPYTLAVLLGVSKKSLCQKEGKHNSGHIKSAPDSKAPSTRVHCEALNMQEALS